MSGWLWIVVMATTPATAVHDGSCVPAPQDAVSALVQSVGEAADLEHARALARTQRFVEDPTTAACVGRDHSHRDYAEARELEKIEQAVKDKVQEVCAANVCASNLGYGLLAWNPWVPVFGGCSNWALAATDAIGQPSYFDKRREQRCSAPMVCHVVVVLTNPRTGDEYVVDAWGYAGGWGSRGGKTGSVFTTVPDFKGKFPRQSWVDNRARGRCTRDEGSAR